MTDVGHRDSFQEQDGNESFSYQSTGLESPVFNYDDLSDEQLEELLSEMPPFMFGVRQPSEIELLCVLFDQLQYTPTPEDIIVTKTDNPELGIRLETIRVNFHQLLRQYINNFYNEFYDGETRDVEKIVELFEQTDDIALTNTISRALDMLRSKWSNNSPAVVNCLAIMRMAIRDR